MKLRPCTLMWILLFVYPKPRVTAKLGEFAYSSKKEVFVQAGRGAKINCEASEPSNSINHGNVDDIVWKKQDETQGLMDIEAGDSLAITDCAEESENCGYGMLSILTIKNTTTADSGLYSCYSESQEIDHTGFIDGSHLYVGYPPDQPTIGNDDFIANMSAEILECCWNVGNDTHIPTTYIMTYCIEHDPPTSAKKMSCEGNSTNEICCAFVYSNFYFAYTLLLEASNALGNATSEEQSIRPCRHAKSSSPTDLKMHSISTQYENKIEANWSEPVEIQVHHFTYMVRFKEKDSGDPWEIQYGTLMPEITLDGLRSETEYVMQVSAHPEDNSGVVEGVWSDWSESESTTTGLSAPIVAFVFNQPVTTILSSGDNFIVDVSWHPYEHEEESGFHSKILYGDCAQKTEARVTGTSHFTFATEETRICVEGKQCNNAGCSKSDVKKIDTSTGPSAIENVIATSINETHLLLQWSPPKDNKAICSIKVCSKSRTSVEGSTTLDRHNSCGFEGFSFVKRLDAYCSLGCASVPGEWSPCFAYSVIVELNKNNFIVQSYPSGKITYDPPPKEVEYFYVNDVSSPDDFKIAVEWSKLDSCHNMPLSIIYQPVEGAECDEKEDKCMDSFTKMVNCDDDSSTISSDVYGYTLYKVQLTLLCNVIDEKAGWMVKAMNTSYFAPIGAAIGEIKTRIGCPDPPRDLMLSTLVKPETVLSWTEPLHENGQPEYNIIQRFSNQPHVMEKSTTTTSISTDIGCHDGNNETIISLSVRAVNTDQDGSSFVSDESIRNVSCVIRKGPLPTGVDPVIILAVCIPLIVVGAVVVAFYCFRKRIKTTLKTHVWPDLPKTSIAINVMSEEYSTEATCEDSEVADYIMMPFSRQEKTPLHQLQPTVKETSDAPSPCAAISKAASLSDVNHSRRNSNDSGHFESGFVDDKLPINSYAFESTRETTLIESDTEDEPYCEAPPPQSRTRLDSSGYSSYNGDSGCCDKFRVCDGSSGSCSTGSCRPHSFSGLNTVGYAKEKVRFCQDLWQKKPLLREDHSSAERIKDIAAEFLNDSSGLLPKGPTYKPPSYVKVCKPVLRRYWSSSDLDSSQLSKAEDDYIDEATWRQHVATPKDIAPADLRGIITRDEFSDDDGYIAQPEHSKLQSPVLNSTPMVSMEENGPYVDVDIAMQM